VRTQFTALSNVEAEGGVPFENAGGAQVPRD
jgi:hypothetical protein